MRRARPQAPSPPFTEVDMRLVIRSAGVALLTNVAVFLLALSTTMTSVVFATLIMGPSAPSTQLTQKPTWPTVRQPLESSLPDLNKLESSLAGMFKKPTNTPAGTNRRLPARPAEQAVIVGWLGCGPWLTSCRSG
jgi:hypothetical protein